VRQLRRTAAETGLAYDIQVDGGLDPHTAPAAAEAGATVMVAATAIFKSELGVAEAVRRLRASAVADTVGQG
jgi:ribulose-phosphate 3-epimerase